jgi:hypothetical protein
MREYVAVRRFVVKGYCKFQWISQVLVCSHNDPLSTAMNLSLLNQNGSPERNVASWPKLGFNWWGRLSHG